MGEEDAENFNSQCADFHSLLLFIGINIHRYERTGIDPDGILSQSTS